MKKLLLLLLLTAVSFALAEGLDCPQCPGLEVVIVYSIYMAPASICLSPTVSEEVYLYCKECNQYWVGETSYSRDEWAELKRLDTEEQKEEKAIKGREATEKERETRREERIKTLVNTYNWTRKRAERVADEYIYIGDTTEIVLEAWGRPEDINRTTTRYGTSEQWVYGLGCYVYFDDGKVTAIQD